jgi:hypothetical protein
MMEDSPRKPESILQEINDLRSIYNQGSELFGKHPEDATLQLLIAQDESRLQELSQELTYSYLHFRRHTVKLVFKNVKEYGSIPIEQLTSTLSIFGKLIDAVSKQVLGSPTPLGLNLSTIFAGSFGVLMNTDYDDELISKFGAMATSLFEYLDKLNTTEPNKLSQFISTKLAFNKKIIRAFRNYFQIQSDYLNDIELEWSDPELKTNQVYIDHQTSFRIYNLLKTFEGFPEVAVEKTGTIRGISLIKHSIEFVPEDQHRLIRAHFDKSLDETVKPFLDRRAQVFFLLKKQLNETTDEIIEEWTVQRIANPQSS